ncbi:ubiquitin-conjugating enzyme E2 32-like [Malania oleifera]|uniref:ubiquitin-conjugating enzyme E2 32-like n=1 Tax=Malania oleifera TaxID=397392 RepID=UPI0025AE214D|nr:ubiquitin-conjugating enzyme E2 32-like [Malania oleifera]XP_057966706.1 ubiquitin-conjugating enzyme E2 32-like [Malania oleifera]
MAEEKHNLKNPAVKRILQEVKEMQENPSDDFMSLPLEDNIFEWQFAIRGPSDSEFEGGIYHGRIQLPAEYPFQPPSFMLLTPNGRFETQTKICLSISNHHPEHWQPSWSVRTALVALIAFMPTDPGGALGSLDYPKKDRRALAIKSREGPPKFGTPQRQMLIDEIHHYMLRKAPPVPPVASTQMPEQLPVNSASDALQVDHQNADAVAERVEQAANPEMNDMIVEDMREVRWNANAGPLRVSFSAGLRVTRRVTVDPNVQLQRQGAQGWRLFDDQLFTLAAVGLAIAIAVLLIKKFLKSDG